MGKWVASACVGFVRAGVVMTVAMLVPAVWAAAVVLWVWVGGGIWIPALIWAAIGTLALSRPVARMVRALVAKWTGTVIPGGYRQAEPVTQLSTGYWWNGFTYERSRRDAVRDQRWRILVRDPANWRDLRFVAIVPIAVGVPAAVPLAGVVAAVLGFAQPWLVVLGVVVAIGSAPTGVTCGAS